MHYLCGHCLAELGDYVEGEPQPSCLDHPGGMVMLVEDGEEENADSQPP